MMIGGQARFARNWTVNPSGAEAAIFWENYNNAMAVDALAPGITRPSAILRKETYNIS